ncbi:group I truncated hemoglobin [Paracidovorax cattleyae]|uniref:Hemoglobin n=1 Tax=Paracidovorax cattleyae TaxID=80868 RepID=A0A1H0NM99_9BURK|nr:group 1 truncated hemoglobin [Paracidovorax cattleyae]AVS75028.1 group 1 truncated hemoglobin [Paracidovorax cattleyae]MBF9266548.1 group 1 truncated hemoglobin [Paracidovorax cattleyae]SDO93783.1 hemoglobin [Paracidovorax cattleyae]
MPILRYTVAACAAFLACGGLPGAMAPARAQEGPPVQAPLIPPPVPRQPVDTSVLPAPPGLYEALGGREGIARVVDRLIDAATVHPQIGPIFKGVRPRALKDSISAQLCVLSGGPCEYEGVSMKDAHADLRIRRSDFNVLVELLQDAMDAEHIPFTQQSRLLALLAPMHRDVITVR